MTRDEFEEWLEERKSDALDDMPQSDTTEAKWIARLYMALKAIVDQENDEVPDAEEEDHLDGDDEDER